MGLIDRWVKPSFRAINTVVELSSREERQEIARAPLGLPSVGGVPSPRFAHLKLDAAFVMLVK